MPASKDDICGHNFYDFTFVFFQDVFQLHTPGGGGYGSRDEARESSDDTSEGASMSFPIGNPSGAGGRTFVERGSVFEYRQAQESV